MVCIGVQLIVVGLLLLLALVAVIVSSAAYSTAWGLFVGTCSVENEVFMNVLCIILVI